MTEELKEREEKCPQCQHRLHSGPCGECLCTYYPEIHPARHGSPAVQKARTEPPIAVGVCREDDPADVDEAYGAGTYARLFPEAEKGRTPQPEHYPCDLLPCPFCGGEAKLMLADDNANFIECQKCGASTNLQYSIKDDARPDLIERWNRRAAASVENSGPVTLADCRLEFEIVARIGSGGVMSGYEAANNAYQDLRDQGMWIAWQAMWKRVLAANSTQKGKDNEKS